MDRVKHKQTTGLLLILIILLVVHESNDRKRHTETKQVLKPMSHDVDSIGDHGRYVIEHHFKYCCEFNSGGETVTF